MNHAGIGSDMVSDGFGGWKPRSEYGGGSLVDTILHQCKQKKEREREDYPEYGVGMLRKLSPGLLGDEVA
jgi:hypothetical protein